MNIYPVLAFQDLKNYSPGSKFVRGSIYTVIIAINSDYPLNSWLVC